ncbi:MAG: NADH-quinone oxidoreductase subunit N [Bacteroidota bacterium]|nr:NADH-quinone oxidoreductase subunit N [Bacteroidota bacterium]
MNSLIILSVLGLFTMMSGLFKVPVKLVHSIVVFGLLSAIGFFAIEWNTDLVYFNDMIYFDNYALGFSILLITITLIIFLLSEYFFADNVHYATEFYSLVIFSLIGMICIVSFDHLSILFIGIEIMSIPLYILAGSNKKDLSSNEAALKYFLMGAFATGLLLMGITLIYGEMGSFHIDKIAETITSYNEIVTSPLLGIGILLMLAGLCFKVSVFPFHFWTPDVYQGAPTWVTTFMSTAVKVAGFAGMFRLFYYCLLPAGDIWVQIAAVLAASTITIGTLTAVFQTSFKRMLAYSSIAHAGYLMLVLAVSYQNSGSTVLFYGLTYSLASIISFSVLQTVQHATGSDQIDAFNGLAKSNPILAFVMTIAILSLAGIPLTGGFFAKFYILSAGIEGGFAWVVIIAIVNAIIGMYYYFKVIIAMYFKESTFKQEALSYSIIYKTVLIVSCLLTIELGLFPDWVYLLF